MSGKASQDAASGRADTGPLTWLARAVIATGGMPTAEDHVGAISIVNQAEAVRGALAKSEPELGAGN
jgi:hypothetical protein